MSMGPEGLKRPLDDLANDLRHGLRILTKNPAFGFVSVLTLAVGIGATTAIFGIVDAVVLRPLPFAGQDRLVTAWKKDIVSKSPLVELSRAEFKDWQAQSQSFSGLAAMPTTAYGYGYVMTGRGEAVLLESSKVTGQFFATQGVLPLLGRVLEESDDHVGAPKVVVLSHRLWRQRFGSDPHVIGEIVALTGEAHTVVGVMPAAFEFPRGVDLWLPLSSAMSPRSAENRGMVFLQAIGRLRAGVSLEQAEAELNTVIARVAAAHPETEAGGERVVIGPLAEHLLGNARPALWLLLAATGMLLLIACANIANLLLARATSRRREVALRAALGAGRGRIVRQLASESLVLAFCGGACGLLLAHALLRWLLQVAPADIPRIQEVRLQGPALLFSLAITLLASLLFGLAPAFAASRVNLNDALLDGGSRLSGDGRGRRMRGALIVAEVAVSVVLLLGAALVVQSFVKLQRVDLGFAPGNVLTMQLQPRGATYDEPAARRSFFRELVERLESQPGVVAASAVLIRPLEGTVGWEASYARQGQSPDDVLRNTVANFEAISPHYFRTFGIRLVAGREFALDDDLNHRRVVIVSESLAKSLFGSPEDAVGRPLKPFPADPDAPWRIVVGVASDVRYRELESVRPDIYIPLEQSESAHINHFAVRTTTEPRAFLAMVRREVAALDPRQAISSVATMDDLVATGQARPRFNAVLLNWLSVVALLLAVLGIHGVVAYSVAERTGELGVRMALGAKSGDILRTVIVEGMRPVGLGLGIGLAAAFGLSRWIAALLFGISATDASTFVGVALTLGLIALLSCWIPARRATKVDPVIALRHE
jgi:putative ABC transport system permease protein